MYICDNCGNTFGEPKLTYNYHPYGMGEAAEEWYVCPYCEDTNYGEAKECERCGELVTKLDLGLCDCCYGEVYGE